MRSDAPAEAAQPDDGAEATALTARIPINRWPVRLIACLILAALYYVSARLGLELAYVSPYVSAVWPPTGLSIAALLLLGAAVWPGVALGAFSVNLLMGGSLIIGASLAAGNTLEALVAVYLVNRFAGGRAAFERAPNVFRFVFLAALTSTTISASIGVTTLVVARAAAWSDFGSLWLTWWLGDATGALMVAPLLIVWAVPEGKAWHRGKIAECGALFVTLALTSLLVFSGLFSWSLSHSAIQFVVAPPLIWAAYRFGPRVATTAVFLLSGFAIWGTLHGFGPFVDGSPNASLLQMQAFLGVEAVTTLVLAAAVLDRERAEESVRATEERLRRSEALAREYQEQRANEAERARDELREFVGMVVHDLRNPLTVVQGNTQLAQRQVAAADTNAGQRTLERTDRALQSMRRLVDDLLDAVRIGSGRFVTVPQPGDLVEVVLQAVEEQRAVDDAHRFVVDLPEELPGSWDIDRLRQVIANLLSNARKYSPSGTEVRVRLQSTNGRVVMTVTDQGVGIAPEQIDQLFQPFARLDQKRAATGTGLGLYITKGIVEAHGGRIWVESTVGQGSTFFIEVPRYPAAMESKE
jgi:signal transduction histidine kinase